MTFIPIIPPTPTKALDKAIRAFRVAALVGTAGVLAINAVAKAAKKKEPEKK